MFFLFMIAILETRLYSGKFHSCYTEHLGWGVRRTKHLVITKWDCLNYGGEWIVPDLNFDTISNSFQTLASIQNSENWT